MSREVRAFIAASLICLLAAAALNIPALLGVGRTWAAFVHAALFGWATGIIYAVRYHGLPTITGRDFPRPHLITLHLACYAAGVALVVGGLLTGWTPGVAWGLALELVAALLFVVNTALLLPRGPQRGPAPAVPPIADQARLDRVSNWATSVAGLCLGLALLLLLAVQQRWVAGSWYLASEHLATLGWVVLMIVGVAYRALPRFSGHPVRGATWARLQLAGHLAGLVLAVGGVGFGLSRVFALGAVIVAASLALFAWTVWPALRRAAQAAAPPPAVPGTGGTTP